MPKQTFFNLPEEKRKLIENVALDEFAQYGFDASNVNRIVEKSKIAKGSFYQYFEDKKDLYFHFINTLFQNKMQAVEPVMKHYKEHSFSHNLSELFRLGMEIADKEPKLYRLGEDFATMQRPFMMEFMQKFNPDSTDIYLCLLIHAQEMGELQEGINISITSALISSLVNQTTASLMGQLGHQNAKITRDAVITEMLAFIDRAVLKNL